MAWKKAKDVKTGDHVVAVGENREVQKVDVSTSFCEGNFFTRVWWGDRKEYDSIVQPDLDSVDVIHPKG